MLSDRTRNLHTGGATDLVPPPAPIAGRIVRYAAAGLIALLFMIPLGWMITTSLRPVGLPPPTGFEWVPPSRFLRKIRVRHRVRRQNSW